MLRNGLVLICLILIACHSKKSSADADGFSFDNFSAPFRAASLPYQVSDTSLAKNRDTAVIRSQGFAALIPDSLRNIWFGKGAKVRYTAMVRLPAEQKTNYFVVRANSASKRIALLLVFEKDQFRAALPLLSPDNDPSTTQVTTVDKSHSVTEITSQKKGNTTAEGRNVYEYSPDLKGFALILTNPLNNDNAEVINPIDTLPRKHKLSGDYVQNKKNFVSIRDGRHPNELMVFAHIERNDGSCTGELKGELVMTSATSAIYRQGGDPCILSFRFTPGAVILKEEEGCGSHRGLDCSFNGSYTKKKEAKIKSARKK